MRHDAIERGRKLAADPEAVEAALRHPQTVDAVVEELYEIRGVRCNACGLLLLDDVTCPACDLSPNPDGQQLEADVEAWYAANEKPGLNPIVFAWLALFGAVAVAAILMY